MKIVLFGKTGQLGWELQHMLPNLGETISFGHEELDVSNLQLIKNTLETIQPNIVINASAYTDVDQAETQIDLAMQINAAAPGVMAETARKIGAIFIHYSTDYVFDGKSNTPYKENDPTNPLNIYGKSKLMGERNVQQTGDAYLILRTSWVYGKRGNNFVNKVLEWSHKNKIMKVVNDQISNPTWVHMLAKHTGNILNKKDPNLFEKVREKHGVYHLAGIGHTSRYEWAKQIIAHDPNKSEQVVETIIPVTSEEFPTKAIRPLFSALDTTKLLNAFHLTIPSWEESLQLAMKK